MHKDKAIAQILLVLSILNLVATVPVVPQEVRGTGHDVVVAAEDVATVPKRRRGEESSETTSLQFPQPSPDESSTHGSLPLGGSAPLQGLAPLSSLAPSSYYFSATDRVPTSAHPLSGAGRPAPVPDQGASTSAHPLSESEITPDYYEPYGVSSDASVDDIKKAYKKMALNWPKANPDGPAPVPDSISEVSSQRPMPQSVSTALAEGSTTPQYTAVTHEMLDNGQAKHTKGKTIAVLTLVGVVTTAIVVYAFSHHHTNITNSTAGTVGTVDMKYQTNVSGAS